MKISNCLEIEKISQKEKMKNKSKSKKIRGSTLRVPTSKFQEYQKKNRDERGEIYKEKMQENFSEFKDISRLKDSP